MKVIILAGGEGLRLRKIIKDAPKPMVKIADRPFLEYLILQLVKHNLKDIILAVGYKKELIKAHFNNGKHWNVNITYSEEKELLGTAGALKKAASLTDDAEFLVMNADSMLDLNFDELISFHRNKKAIATIALTKVDDLSRYGRVQIDSDNRIIKFDEKGSVGGGFVNGGVYILNRKIIHSIPLGKVSLERNILPHYAKQKLYGMITDGFFIDIGVPEDFLSLCNNPEKLFIAAGL